MKKQHKALFAMVPLFGIALGAVGVFAADSTTAATTAQGQVRTHDGFKGGRGHGPKDGEHKTEMNKDLSEVLGISVADLEAAQKAGKSIDTLITEKGLDKATVFKALDAKREAAMQARIQAEIASGKITQAQADEMAAKHKAEEATRDANLSKVLGITTDELAAYKAAGKNIDTIITEKGLNKETVFKALEASRPKGEKGKKGPHGENKFQKSTTTSTTTN